ncbi:MAG: response regulator [Clostridia bacterium]|nr:response regulator [Clostridia bacterium]
MQKIVLVDDYKDWLIVLKEFIEGNNDAKCITFVNPLDALEYILKGNDVDIVITDYQMPQMNGFELSKKLVENSIKARIIVSSGYDTFTLANIRKQYGLEKMIEITTKGDMDFLINLCS